MIRNGGSQIIRYYMWIQNVWKYIINKLVIPVSCNIEGKNELEVRESKHSLV